MKTYSLTQDETTNIIGREKTIEYVNDIVSRDINMYLSMEVLKRLGITPDGKTKFKLSADRKSLEVEDELIIPNGKKVH